MIAFAVFLFAIAVGVYFAYSLVTGRKDGALSSFIAFPVLIVASALVALTVFLASAAFNSYAPTKDEIKSISVFAPETEEWYHHIEYSDYVDKRAGNIILTDEQSKEILARAIARGVELDNHTKYHTVSFKINTGFDSYRTLRLTEEEYTSIISTLATNEEYKELWLNVNEGAFNVSVSNYLIVEGADAEAILAALAQEVRELGFDKWFSAYRDSDAEARLQYYIELDGQTLIVSLPISKQMPKTYALYLEKERIATEKLVSTMKAAIESCVSGTGDELYVSFNLTTSDKTTYWIESDLSVGDRDKQLLYLEVLGLLSFDHVNYEDDTVYITINCDDSFSDHYYGNFKVSPENLDRLTEIFTEYGETYRTIE